MELEARGWFTFLSTWKRNCSLTQRKQNIIVTFVVYNSECILKSKAWFMPLLPKEMNTIESYQLFFVRVAVF